MPQDRHTGNRRDGAQRRQDNQSGEQTAAEQTTAERMSGWFAVSVARIGLVLVGLVLLLFALGQAVGTNLLGLAVEAVTSRMGQWLVVAFFAILLVAIAARWGRSPTTG